MQVDFTAEKKRFDKAHGSDAIQIDGVMLFSDGARRTMGQAPEFYEPSNDEFKRAETIAKYHATVLQRAVEEFRAIKQAAVNHAKGSRREKLPPLDKNKLLKALKQAHQNVLACQERSQNAQLALEAAIPDSVSLRQEDEAEALEECNEMLEKIKEFKI